MPDEHMGCGALRTRVDLEEAGHGAAGQLHISTLPRNLVAGPALVLSHVRIPDALHHQQVSHGIHIVVQRAIPLQLGLVTGGVGSQGHGESMVEPLDRGRRRSLHDALEMGTSAQLGVHHGLGLTHLGGNCN